MAYFQATFIDFNASTDEPRWMIKFQGPGKFEFFTQNQIHLSCP